MVKEKKILLYFISFILGLLTTMIVGISNVFAQIIDYRFMNTTVENNFSVSANSSLSATTYINVTGDSTRKYLVVDICSTVGSGFSTEVISNFDGSNTNFYKMYNLGESCTTNGGYIGATVRIYYLIKSWSDSGNGNQAINNTTKFNNALSYSGIFELISVSLSDNVDTGDLSLNNQNIIINEIGSLNNSITNTEQNITNSITDTENNINQNIDNMESAIVDSNKETQEVIKDQFNSCRDSYNLTNLNEYEINLNGYFNSKLLLSNFENNTTYTLSFDIESDVEPFLISLGYGNNDSYMSDFRYITDQYNGHKIITFTTNNNTYSDIWIRIPRYSTLTNAIATVKNIMLVKGNIELPYEPYGEEICNNKIDETNDKLDGIQGALTDSSAPNTSGLENSAGWLPAGPLDSVLNLPLSLFNALTTNLNKSCNPINIPLPYVNKNITLPCINTLYNQIGITSFLSWIGVIVSGLMLYTYLLKLYKWIEDRISLNETHNVDSWGGL